MAYPDQAAPGRAPIPTFNFLLQPEFPLNALVLASESLRIANQNSGRELFAWRFVSETGGPVRASNGMWLSVDTDFAAMPLADFYLLFEGNLPVQANSPRLLQQLRTATRFGATVGAVDTGAFALAQGGLVDDHAIVLHWEAVPTFRERFPQLSVLNQIYLIDAQRMSCAGGVAILDMMLDLIGRLKTPALANEVANALVYARRAATAPQRSDEWAGRDETTLSSRIVAIMEQNLDFPLSLEEIAKRLEVSSKTIARECLRHLAMTPMRLYLRLRLQAARNMLFYDEFAITEVAMACGFSYPSVFSRAFRAQFGQTPRAFRAALRREQDQALRPEVRRLFLERAA